MGRPRKNQQDSAVSRMEAAFFSVMEETPYEKLTVRAIVAAAGVNRNSFYYHYSGIDDLARSAVSGLLVPEIPRLFLSGFGPDSEQVQRIFESLHGNDRLHRVSIVLGPNSTSELRAMLKDSVLELWLTTFEITTGDLSAQELATVNFLLAGVFELVSGVREPEVWVQMRELTALPVIKESMRITIDTLASAGERP